MSDESAALDHSELNLALNKAPRQKTNATGRRIRTTLKAALKDIRNKAGIGCFSALLVAIFGPWISTMVLLLAFVVVAFVASCLAWCLSGFSFGTGILLVGAGSLVAGAAPIFPAAFLISSTISFFVDILLIRSSGITIVGKLLGYKLISVRNLKEWRSLGGFIVYAAIGRFFGAPALLLTTLELLLLRCARPELPRGSS